MCVSAGVNMRCMFFFGCYIFCIWIRWVTASEWERASELKIKTIKISLEIFVFGVWSTRGWDDWKWRRNFFFLDMIAHHTTYTHFSSPLSRFLPLSERMSSAHTHTVFIWESVIFFSLSPFLLSPANSLCAICVYKKTNVWNSHQATNMFSWYTYDVEKKNNN